MKTALAAGSAALIGVGVALGASVRIGSLLVAVALLIIAGERFRDRKGVTLWRSRRIDLAVLLSFSLVILTLALLLPSGG